MGAFVATAAMLFTVISVFVGGDLETFGLPSVICIGVVTLPLWGITYALSENFMLPPRIGTWRK